MILPKLNGKAGSEKLTKRFLGIQQVDIPAEGAFFDAENISSERYPVMSVRRPRQKVRTLSSPGGITAKTELAWVDGNQLYYDGEAVAEVEPGEKDFVSMGAWLIVWPDGVRYNTRDKSVDRLGQKNTSSGTVSFTLCEVDGTEYTDYIVSDTAPEDTGKYWLCTSDKPHVLKKYNSATELWNSIPTTYVKIEATGIGMGLSEGDTVTVSGVEGSEAETFNADFLLADAKDNCIVVTAIIDETFSQTEEVTVERKIPEIEYLVEYGNRLWGCSSETNEIYACKMGDPKNWNCYAGLATDSYAATVGSDGPFTGAAVQGGYVLFFKENCIHTVYGTKPSNFQIEQLHCEGVQPGSERSLCTVGSTLYYKADHGVMAFDGSTPNKISAALGDVFYKNAAAGTECGKLILSMENAEREPGIFVYDTQTGIWCREDGLRVTQFTSLNGNAYALDDEGNIWRMTPENGEETEGPVKWWAETGILDPYTLDAQYQNRIRFRIWIEEKSSFMVQVQYDDGEWELVWSMVGKKNGAVLIPVVLRRCDHLKIRIGGTGACKIYAMSHVLAVGSEQREEL